MPPPFSFSSCALKAAEIDFRIDSFADLRGITPFHYGCRLFSLRQADIYAGIASLLAEIAIDIFIFSHFTLSAIDGTWIRHFMQRLYTPLSKADASALRPAMLSCLIVSPPGRLHDFAAFKYSLPAEERCRASRCQPIDESCHYRHASHFGFSARFSPKPSGRHLPPH